jgi:CRISPR-associated protein Cas1
MLRLASEGITVVLINPRNSAQQAMVMGPAAKNPHIRLWQYEALQDSAFSDAIAQQWVQAKIRNQSRFLQRQLLSRDDLRYPLSKAVKQLDSAVESLHSPIDVVRLRGIEGNAARIGFGAYQHLFPESLGFTGRKRRPPPDPVNACLSLAYTLLHTRATQQAYAQGLDPMLGFLHEPKYSRDSLAADLIEPWRPHVDEWVWRLFNERELRSEDFSQDQNCCLLGKAGRYRFYSAYEQQLKPLTRALRFQVRQLRRQLETHYKHRVSDETPIS